MVRQKPLELDNYQSKLRPVQAKENANNPALSGEYKACGLLLTMANLIYCAITKENGEQYGKSMLNRVRKTTWSSLFEKRRGPCNCVITTKSCHLEFMSHFRCSFLKATLQKFD